MWTFEDGCITYYCITVCRYYVKKGLLITTCRLGMYVGVVTVKDLHHLVPVFCGVIDELA